MELLCERILQKKMFLETSIYSSICSMTYLGPTSTFQAIFFSAEYAYFFVKAFLRKTCFVLKVNHSFFQYRENERHSSRDNFVCTMRTV